MKKILALSLFCLLLLFSLLACSDNGTCTIVFHADDSLPFTQLISRDALDGFVPPAAPEKEGHTFIGWYLDEACTKDFNVSVIAGKSTVDVYAGYARNAHTVTIVDGAQQTTRILPYGDEITPPLPSSALLEFDGFYTDSDFERKLTDTKMPDKDLTLYVKWKMKPAFTVTVVFHADDKTFVEAIPSAALDAYEWPTPEKEGHLFDGWYLNEACTTPFDPKSITGECTLSLYAKHEKNWYSITVFDGTGSQTYTLQYGDTLTLPEPPSEQYVFEGFYLDAAFAERLTFDRMPAANLTVYVKWKNAPGATVTVFLHGAAPSRAMLLLQANEFASYEWPTPEKEGHTFLGWYLDATYRTPFDPQEDTDTDTLNLYAKYRVNSYTLTVHDGANKTVYTFTYGQKIVLDEPSSDYFAFVGFYLDRNSQTPFSYVTMPGTNLDIYVKWGLGSTVTVKSSITGALNFKTDGVTVKNETAQLIVRADQFKPVTVTADLGYRYLGYEIGGIFYEGNTITISQLNGDLVIRAIADYATYELPIVNITTKNGNGINSKIDYTEMTFSLINTEKELRGIEGGIRLRGNTTTAFPKQPYRIKFDKKQSLFGHEKAKSWVLLAEYIDPSALHNYTALSIGGIADGMKFNATPHKVNVYVNGRFDGLYTLCEQIQEDEGRIDIEQTITPDMTDLRDYNFFFCLDESVSSDIDAIEGETYFVIKKYGTPLYFELKYPEKADFPSEAQFYSFFSQWTAYVEEMMDIARAKDYTRMQQEFNLDSLVDYFIIDQIMGEHDHATKSFNMYHTVTSTDEREIGRLTFGPIWDYDWCLHTPWTGHPNIYYELEAISNYSNAFFRAVRDIEPLYTRVKERYQNHFYPRLIELLPELYQLEADMNVSYGLNALRWYNSQPTITTDNIRFLNEYLVFTIERFRVKWALS